MKKSKTLTRLNENIDILSTYPVGRFIKITDTPILSKGLNPNTFLFLSRLPLKFQDLRVEPTQSLTFDGDVGALLGLNSGPDFLCGYILKFRPNIEVQSYPYYITSVKQSKDGPMLPVTHVLNLESLSVYKVGVDYLVASSNTDIVNHLT